MREKARAIGLALYALSVLGAALWLLGHEACAHPAGNLLAFTWILGIPVILTALMGEEGR